MVSLDPPERNRAFAESVGAGFPLLSDPDGKVARAYGVATEGRRYARRWTFFIDGTGIIRHIDRDVTPSSHGSDLVRMLDSLGLTRK
jgi:peroxiredoxin Q/BCP